jgi:hypothetical protein
MGSARAGHAGVAVRTPELTRGLRPSAALNVPSLGARVRSRVGFSRVTNDENDSRQRRATVPAAFSHRAACLLHMLVWRTARWCWEGFGYQQQGRPVHNRMRPESRNAARTIGKLASTTKRHLSLAANDLWLRGPE